MTVELVDQVLSFSMEGLLCLYPKLYCKVMPSLLPLVLVLVLVLVGGARCGSNPHHQPTDYAAWLREDDIAGLKVT